ncbi:hypothetical protein JCM10213_008653 [Rhodosporidiobolus nylandii]
MRPTQPRRPQRHRLTALTALLALSAPSTSSASFLSTSLDSLRARALLPRQAGVAYSVGANNTDAASGGVSARQATSVEGRYGHSAVYLAEGNKLLLLGGQLDSANGSSATGGAPEVSSAVLQFNLASTFLWGDRPVSAIPDNPSTNTTLSSSFPGAAFGAAAATSTGDVWLLGGLSPSDCTASPALVFSQTTEEWAAPSPELSPRTPPRRRQASAVPVQNSTTGGTDIWVFGGIAEQWTCAEGGETVGYVGIDRYDTVGGSVESLPWLAPEGAAQGWAAPVSDYSATFMELEEEIVIVGGQTAQGELVDMSSVLLFDVESRSWTAQPVKGDIPSSRMGHVAVPLTSGSILLHGGLSATHSPLSDTILLTPSSTGWTYKTLEISTSSLLSPSLAWHTATLVPGETIVVAFGIDASTAQASSEFYFLTVDEAAGTYTWKDTFDGNAAAVSSSEGGASRLRKKALEVVVNPKAESLAVSSAPAVAHPVQTAAAQEPVYYAGGGAAPSSSTSSLSSVHLSSASSPSSSSSSSATTVASAAPVKQQSSDSSSGSSKKTAIAASLGAIGGAVALAGLAVLLLRRRAAQNAAHFAVPASPAIGSGAAGGMGERNGAQPVSTLMYTRPVQRRHLSLGSTISPVPSRLGEDGEEVAEDGGLGATPDPFSDQFQVNELGQLERSASSASAGSTAGVVGALKSSVQSIPFLSTVTHSSPKTNGGDVYTSPAPTLTAKRSVRRPGGSQTLPPLPAGSPTPQTPAELIGLAVTSEDGHAPAGAEQDGLPYMQGGEKKEAWEQFIERNAATPPPAVPAAASGLPPSLRPGTPLRVANPDPFQDQQPRV